MTDDFNELIFKKNNLGKIRYPSGNTYVGQFLNNKKHGFGNLACKNGDQFSGEYKNDFINGKGKFFCKIREF